MMSPSSDPRTAEPIVSVVVLCYNQRRFLETSLPSVLSQKGVAIELTVVDDASTDGSQELITRWTEQNRVEANLLFHETNCGISRSLNDGILAGRAPFVGLLAADDYWLPGKLARQVALMRKLQEDVGALYGDAFLCDEAGVALRGRFIGTQTRELSRPRPSGWLFRSLLVSNFIPGPSTLIRRQCFTEIGGFDETLVYEDYEFWLRLSRRFQIVFDDTLGCVYRVVPHSAVRRLSGQVDRDTIRVYRRYLDDAVEGTIVTEQISVRAWRVYIIGEDDGLRYLLMSLRYRFTFPAMLMLGPALLGLRGRPLKLLRRSVKHIVTTLRRI